MSADREVTPVVRSWLEQRGEGLVDPSHGFDRLMQIVDTTPQVRRRPWAPGSPTATTRTTRRSPSMFSATRLIAVIAVAALGTGALFFAAGPGPSPVASPSPMPTPALTFREVEPGVMKVVDDRAGHDLDGMPLTGIATGPDGTVWLLTDEYRDKVADGLLVLGQPGTHSAGDRSPVVDLAMAPDGTLWGIGWQATAPAWFDGDAWNLTVPLPGAGHDVEVSPDGSVWVAWTGEDGKEQAGRLGADGWQVIDSGTSPAMQVERVSLAVGADDDVWMGAWYGDARSLGWVGLLHSDGAAWTVEHPVGPRDDLSAGPMAMGPDGTLWVYQAAATGSGSSDSEPGWYLTRRGTDGWAVFSADDGVPLLVGNQVYIARLAVAADGTLWIAIDTALFDAPPLPPELGPQAPGDCPGVLSFDGGTWRQYLVGTCINQVAFAPDGAVWAISRTGMADDSQLTSDGLVSEMRTAEVPERAGLYLIRPEQDAAQPST